jgi:hypothetical protein
METPVVTYDYQELVYKMMEPVLAYMVKTVIEPLKELGDMVCMKLRWKLREQPKTSMQYCMVFWRMQNLRFYFPCDVREALDELGKVVVQSVSTTRNVPQLLDPKCPMKPADWVNYSIEVPRSTFLSNLVSEIPNGGPLVKIESNDMLIDAELIRKVLAVPTLPDMINVEGLRYSHLDSVYMLLHGLEGPHDDLARFRVFNVIVYSIQMSLLSKRYEDRYGGVLTKERPTYPFFAFVMNFMAKQPDFFRLTKYLVQPESKPTTVCIKASVHLQHGHVTYDDNWPIFECEAIAGWRVQRYRHYVLNLIRRYSA